MHVIQARNVNHAYILGNRLLRERGQKRSSRVGDVLEMTLPVTTHYERPAERVLFDAARDANPFFHFFEALWMLAGRNDIEWLAQLNARMRTFSDDGVTQHGAYGYRWRTAFGRDQLDLLVELFERDPDTRRAYLQMWASELDLGRPSADLPCNVGIKFEQRDGKLNMIVFNRSNDLVWGAYGANVVHMSMLQEYLAARCGFAVGWYEQVSANFHAYIEIWRSLGLDQSTWIENDWLDPYERNEVYTYPLVHAPNRWDGDLKLFLSSPGEGVYDNPFFGEVALPLWIAYQFWREQKDRGRALDALEHCAAPDWARAGREWLLRRKKAS